MESFQKQEHYSTLEWALLPGITDEALFYRKAKKGRFRLIETPSLPKVPRADAHAHLHSLADPPLALVRAGRHLVHFICTIVDPTVDGDVTFRKLSEWQQKAYALLTNEVNELRAQEIDSEKTVSVRNPRVPRVRIAVGCHPHNARLYDGELEQTMRMWVHDRRVCAIGEIGLDYHYDLSPRPLQVESFRRQLTLAHELGLPVVLHIREAHDDALTILDAEGVPQAGVLLHCCTIGSQDLRPWLERGCAVSFGGALTFANADAVREAAACTPDDRLLIETDTPYMAPVPLRGLPCEPAQMLFTLEKLFEVRGCNTAGTQEALMQRVFTTTCNLLDRDSLPWQQSR